MKDKELIIRYLSQLVPYGVRCEIVNLTEKNKTYHETILTYKLVDDYVKGNVDIKPYLRPISSMKKEEKKEILKLLFGKHASKFSINRNGYIDGISSGRDFMSEGIIYPSFRPIMSAKYIDWLNKNHFDYNNLIKKDAAYKL